MEVRDCARSAPSFSSAAFTFHHYLTMLRLVTGNRGQSHGEDLSQRLNVMGNEETQELTAHSQIQVTWHIPREASTTRGGGLGNRAYPLLPILCFLPVPTSVSCDSESLCMPPHFPQTLPTRSALSSLVFGQTWQERRFLGQLGCNCVFTPILLFFFLQGMPQANLAGLP